MTKGYRSRGQFLNLYGGQFILPTQSGDKTNFLLYTGGLALCFEFLQRDDHKRHDGMTSGKLCPTPN